MDSNVSPCSGFVAVNDEGVPCAGFRQCGSNHGATGLNPKAQKWDVPMEVRCSTNANLTAWGPPQWLYPVYFYRGLPYDPVRPWKDTDGKWYSALSTDGCNATTRKTPCAAGGRLDLFVADKFDGPWTQLPAMFTTNTTMSGGAAAVGAITREFVTSGYFGGLPGDPDVGATRVVTQNNAGPTYWVGKQSNGSPFEPYWSKPGAVGHYDYGSLTMARTLGADPNQVATNGRRVLVGWIGGTPASQSLARDLTLSSDYELLQQFVPELQGLRLPASAPASQQVEVVASFPIDPANPPKQPFGVEVLGSADGKTSTKLFVDCSAGAGKCVAGVDTTAAATVAAAAGKTAADADADADVADAAVGGGRKVSGPVMPANAPVVRVHAIVDHSIIEAIYNNRTAMVVYTTPGSAADNKVQLFGVSGDDAQQGLVGEPLLEVWQLASANNLA